MADKVDGSNLRYSIGVVGVLKRRSSRTDLRSDGPRHVPELDHV